MPINYSEYTENIISQKPPMIIKYGITVFFLFLLLLIIFTWFIKYPDIIVADGKLVNIQSPKTVITHSDGKLIKLFVKENEFVQQNQIIGYIESLVNANFIQNVDSQLNSIIELLNYNKTDSLNIYFNQYFIVKSNNNFGELQNVFQIFMQSYNVFKDYLPTGYFFTKKNVLQKDLARIKQLNLQLKIQETYIQKDIEITMAGFKSNEILLKEKVISQQDFRNEQSKLINKQLILPQIKTAIINNESLYNEKLKEIDEINHQQETHQNNFKQNLLTLQSAVQAWEYKYVIKSSIAGNFHFNNFLQENQDVKNNEAIGFVTPINNTYFVTATIPQYNFGKIKIKQNVLLKFDAFPYEQYGAVIGKIAYINPIPTDKGYVCKINLTSGLKTQYNKYLVFNEGLILKAYIITQEKRLLQRFYKTIVKTIH